MRLLDLFCGAGGAAMGYHRAGFDVVGVDINPQPHYPFEFIQADAVAFLASLLRGSAFGGLDVRPIELYDFDAIHASPPCQAYSIAARLHPGSSSNHPDLVDVTRELLDLADGTPYVIENVKGSPLDASMLLCGTMFGLRIRKHRYFETNWELPILAPATCNHADVYDPYHGEGRTTDKYRAAQDTPWMPAAGGWSRSRGKTGDVSNAIPPAYTEWIGTQLLAALKVTA